MKIINRDATSEEIKHIYDDFTKIEIALGIPQVERKRYSYIAEENGEVIGFVSGLAGHKWLTLTNMWVKAEHRRNGIGTKLHCLFEEKIKATGIEHIHTWMMNIQPGNENDFTWTIGCGNEHFYERVGYSICAVIENFFNVDGIHHVAYRKDLLAEPNEIAFSNINFIDREITQNELKCINELMKQERQKIFPQRNQARYYRVIENNGEIIGYAAGYTNYDWFMLTDMWTKQEYRRQGLGSKLLQELEKQMHDIGIKHVYTWTMGEANARYYESVGYMCFTVLENSFGVEGIHHIGFRKDL